MIHCRFMMLIKFLLRVVVALLSCYMSKEIGFHRPSIFVSVIIFLFDPFDFKLAVNVELALCAISVLLYGFATTVVVVNLLFRANRAIPTLHFRASTDYIFIPEGCAPLSTAW